MITTRRERLVINMYIASPCIEHLSDSTDEMPAHCSG